MRQSVTPCNAHLHPREEGGTPPKVTVRTKGTQICGGGGALDAVRVTPHMHTRRGRRRCSRPTQGSSPGPCIPRGEAPRRRRESVHSGPEQKIRRIRKKICAPRGAPKAKARKTLIKIPRKYAEEEGSPPARNCDTLHPRGGGGAERRAQVPPVVRESTPPRFPNSIDFHRFPWIFQLFRPSL